MIAACVDLLRAIVFGRRPAEDPRLTRPQPRYVTVPTGPAVMLEPAESGNGVTTDEILGPDWRERARR